ncbi:hypothetical protein L1987_02594 [Smallanthus sonchifolius]|uniref:Uncharacterized protein n=1 Tax=Smallanthus sonchifolius TaxID=185202 RepID=A0ACB9K8D2_9ASTR|nr:hypothetical protein L1987_02594 [Smallanthus sonchifolius]
MLSFEFRTIYNEYVSLQSDSNGSDVAATIGLDESPPHHLPILRKILQFVIRKKYKIKKPNNCYMDGSYSKRAVRENSAPKKKPATAVKDTAGSRDGTGQPCNRIGCCGRVNHNTKGTKYKTIEKTKPLMPSFRSSSSKETKGGSSKSFSKSKTESSSVPNGPEIQELNASRSQTSKSNSESNNGRKKRLTQGESSSSGKGKRIIGVSTNEARVFDPKKSRNVTSSRTNDVSLARTRKPLNLETSKGSMNQQSSSAVTNMSQTQESSLNGDHSTSDASSDRATVGFANDNGRGHFNIDGIADLLLALDRYGHSEELTYEHLLSLEANLFLSGLNFYDRHRDMRLDIDNMSYEELLVLEEKMGTVSTALSAEELSKCIKTSIYESLQLENGKTRHSSCVDDSKCSICQEEFVRGDEIGRLGCGHGYHAPCINQWLGLKNWCPICKASPTPA